MPTIDFDALPRLSDGFQNDDHRHEASLVNRAVALLEAAGPGPARAPELVAVLDELERFTREHFLREDEAMQRTDFPPYRVHRAEHERVLAQLAAKLDAYRRGGAPAALLSYLKNDVPEWFARHLATMDQATAQWLAHHPR